MTHTTTLNDLKVKVSALESMTGLELQLVQGSPTYGRAWRLYATKPNGGLDAIKVNGETILDGYGYLGWSKREARETLETIIEDLLKN